MVVIVAFVVLLTQGQRKIPVQYAKRVVGRRVYGGQTTHIPLRINSAGVIPIIFAQSIMFLPGTVTPVLSRKQRDAVARGLFHHGFPFLLGGLRHHDRVLLLFLHRDRDGSESARGQHEAARRLHTGGASRQTHGDIH